ncbi:hypothetical protein [Psychroserpens sp.]|uniref:hypothetical protein n=1 Tax=Psychroserpens sp. TaxID=2020870 RepID=UPI003C7872B1
MKIKNSFFLLITFFISLMSCSKEEIDNTPSIIGDWVLTSYNIGILVDLDKDGNESLNLLDEMVCENNEILTFTSEGIVSSNNTFHPTISVLQSDLNGDYMVDVECAEGAIGFTSTYSFETNSVNFNNNTSRISEDTLETIYENAVEIYNLEGTEIVEIKNLTLTYSKR